MRWPLAWMSLWLAATPCAPQVNPPPLSIRVGPGEAVETRVTERSGMPGILVARMGGQETAFVDLSRRTPSGRGLLLPEGLYELKVLPANHSTVEHVFSVEAAPARKLTPRDLPMIEAQRALGEGERIYRRKQPGYLEEARAHYESALRTWEKTADRVWQACALNHLAYVLYEQGEMKAALEAYQRQLDLAVAADDAALAAAGWQGLALVSVDTAQPAKASAYAAQALEARRAMGDLRGQAETLFVLGSVHVLAGKNEDARAENAEARDLARRAGDRVREADAINFLAVQEFQSGQFTQAAAGYEAALAIDREENEPVRAAQRLSNLGALQIGTGELRAAVTYLEQALPIRKALASPGAYANTLYNLGVAHLDLGDTREARDCFEEALPLFRKVNSRNGEGFVLQGLAGVRAAEADSQGAEALLRQALAIWHAMPQPRGETQTLNRIGEILTSRHDFSGARALHERALALAVKGQYQREEAQSQEFLSTLALRTTDFSGALEHAVAARDLSRKLGDRIVESGALLAEGQARARLGDREKARQALEAALALHAGTGAPQGEAEAMREIARLDRSEGHTAEAVERIAGAIARIESARANIGSTESRMRVAAAHRDYYDLAIGLAMDTGDAAKALEISERARARGLIDLLMEARLDLRAGLDPQLAAREKTTQELLNAKHDRWIRMLAPPRNAAREAVARQEIDALIARYQEIETEIREKSPRYAELTQPRALTFEALRGRAVAHGVTAVEFWLGESVSFAWVLTNAGCRGFVLPAGEKIAAAARRAHRAASTMAAGAVNAEEARRQREASAKEFAAAMRDLSPMVAAPFLAAAPGARLEIVSDGALDYVPFAALPMPSGRLLIDAHEIMRLPSLSVPPTAPAPAGPQSAALVFADPVFGPADSRLSQAAAAPDTSRRRETDEDSFARLERLQFSRLEAQAIARLAPHGAATLKLGFDANLAELKELDLTRYRVLHFATHGLVNVAHPELSGLALSLLDPGGRPLDGFLRLHDIYNLKLRADLVVLSGCRTALGAEVRSEGLVGMTRGFLYAGARGVMASLWSVRDRATAELMTRFYEGLFVRRLQPAAALREAQLAIRRDPAWGGAADWAAFTLQGVW